MSWIDPSLLWAGVALTGLVLVGLRSHFGRRRQLAEFLGGRRALDRLSRSDLSRFGIGRALLLGLAGLALATAAAGPRWSEAPVPLPPVKRVILAIDVSASMQASDVSPTRLARAVAVAGDMIDALEDHEVGLLMFAGTAYPLAPPTHDHGALRFLLRGLTPTLASAHDPGTLVSVAIDGGVALLERKAPALVETGTPVEDAVGAARAPVGEQLVVLIGDGDTSEDEGAVRKAVDMAREAGYGIHTVGVGTEEGAGMIMPSGTYQLGGPVLDARGARGFTRLGEPFLRDVAARGGGRYASDRSEADLLALLEDLRARGVAPEQSPVEGAPAWARYDLPFVLGLGALVLVLTESLLGMSLPRLRPLPARELT